MARRAQRYVSLVAVFRELLTLAFERVRSAARAVHFVRRGERASAGGAVSIGGEMIDALDRIRDGRVLVQCHRTFMKRIAAEIAHGVDARPFMVLPRS